MRPVLRMRRSFRIGSATDVHGPLPGGGLFPSLKEIHLGTRLVQSWWNSGDRWGCLTVYRLAPSHSFHLILCHLTCNHLWEEYTYKNPT